MAFLTRQFCSDPAEAITLFHDIWDGTKRREPAQPQRLRWQIRGLGAEPLTSFLQNVLTLHCLPLLSRIRDNSGYPERKIIPKSRRKALQRKTSLMIFSG